MSKNKRPKITNECLDPGSPINHLVRPLLTDLYQITMCYAYFKTGRHEEQSVFDLFFRKNPFKGEFTIFAGLNDVIKFVANFYFNKKEIDALKNKFPSWDLDFFDWLATLTSAQIRLYAIPEGTIVFPRIPLIRVEGPLATIQLMETTMLLLVNYASLLSTNAARHRLAVGPNKKLIEFGARRAQGPDGALSASRYAYLGGFDSTSNVLAATMFDITCSGTHAHSFVSSFSGFEDLKTPMLVSSNGGKKDFLSVVKKYRELLKCGDTNIGELAAFVAYSQAYPSGFLALIDTYDTIKSGMWNFLCVALSLEEFGYHAVGVRLDSGDLAYLSKECQKTFTSVGEKYNHDFSKFNIVASNDINEEILYSLNEQGHSITTFGIGTHLVTCKAQPALGCVFKLVEIDKKPRIKLSQEIGKVTIPAKKECFRLYNSKQEPILDLMVRVGDDSIKPEVGKKILCRHPFDDKRRCVVIPSKIELLHRCYWDGKLLEPLPTLKENKKRCEEQLSLFRKDHLRKLNPTPYKVSLASDIYDLMQSLWHKEAPILELS